MIPSQFYLIFFLSLLFNTLAFPMLQRDALLEFKNEFSISALDQDSPFYASLSSWNASSDHCSWEGVTCSANSSEVTSLTLEGIFLNGSLKANTSLLKLQHLHHLTFRTCFLRGEIPSSLGNLSNLKHLDISGNDDLGGEIPPSIGNLSHLMHLDLCCNELEGKIPSSLGNLSHLNHLDLSCNGLVGKIPSSLGNLSRLTNLDLSENHLIGEIPSSIGNLDQLTFTSFGSNNLSGNIPGSFANFNNLSHLILSQNQFSGGDLSLILANLTSLSTLDISYNHITSRLPSNMSGLHNLARFIARGNSFVGNVPTSLFMIHSLQEASLSENQLEGTLDFGNTSSSSELHSLELAYNNLYGPIQDYISRFLKLYLLDLSHNNFNGPIPGSISKLASLESLDLSYNKLEGQVPSFLWRMSTLKLSHNSFSSLEESVQDYGLVYHIYLGSNSLQGAFPRWICKVTSLDVLDLSNNHLTGSIPSCLKNSTASLGYINLRNNSLSGVLPDIFTNATRLRSLDVSRNQLVGKIPKSLINCKSMEYLNLKGNKIKDTFPSWLISLGSILRVLFLGSNAFYGPISSDLGFPSLRVIDVSHNSFSGTLPQDYFVNWHEMLSSVEETDLSVYLGEVFNYEDSMDMMYKGVDTEFQRIFHEYKAIDFSGNKFTGLIPKSIGLLKGLLHVNFSRNAFKGSIPSSLANLTNLEALDLSHNNLSGNIPRDLANLSFLSYLDFSHNLLQGPVPRSTQFQRQRCSSFDDNLGLYGLDVICGEIHAPNPPPSGDSEEVSSESEEEVLNWISASIACGPGVFCGLVIGHIFFSSEKYKWFVEKFGRNYPGGIITVR